MLLVAASHAILLPLAVMPWARRGDVWLPFAIFWALAFHVALYWAFRVKLGQSRRDARDHALAFVWITGLFLAVVGLPLHWM
jgi:hypothetical protein